MAKDTELFGLSKIPDSVLLKKALKEIGMLKAEIDELKYNRASEVALKSSILSVKHHNKKLTRENKLLRNELVMLKLNKKQ